MRRAISRPVYALLAICALSVVAVYQLRLSPADQLEAETSAMPPEVALARLSEADAAGTLDHGLRLRLGELALAVGDIGEARRAFERLAEVPAFTAIAEEHLADIAAATGALAEAAAHLAIAYRAEPDPAMRMRLGGWYRVIGDRDAEERLLSSVMPTALSEAEALRLVDLHRAAGSPDRMEALLDALTHARGDVAGRWRLRKLDFLLDTERPDAAWHAARAWWTADADPARLGDFVGLLLDRGAITAASALVEAALADRPDSAHVAILPFVESGYGVDAIALEQLWLAALEEPNAGAWATVIAIAGQSGDARGVWMLLARSRNGRVDPALVGAALEQVLRYQGPRALERAREWLTPEVMDEAPLLAAAVATDGRALHDALLQAAYRPMNDWQLALWTSIAASLKGSAGWGALLNDVPAGSPAAAALSRSIIAPAPPGASR